MSSNIKVGVSILCADFNKLGDEVKKCEDAGVDILHIDVMDGHFVPNITIGSLIVEAIRPITNLPIDVHFMIENPGAYIDSFIDAGSDGIYVQIECYGKRINGTDKFGVWPKEIESVDMELLRDDIAKIKKRGKQAFIVVNPKTKLCFDEVLGDIDGVLIMSVNPGFAKQKFMPEVLPKIEELRKKFQKDIAIDGGIKAETAPMAVQSGANILATASYFFGADDPKEAVKYLKSLQA